MRRSREIGDQHGMLKFRKLHFYLIFLILRALRDFVVYFDCAVVLNSVRQVGHFAVVDVRQLPHERRRGRYGEGTHGSIAEQEIHNVAVHTSQGFQTVVWTCVRTNRWVLPIRVIGTTCKQTTIRTDRAYHIVTPYGCVRKLITAVPLIRCRCLFRHRPSGNELFREQYLIAGSVAPPCHCIA